MDGSVVSKIVTLPGTGDKMPVVAYGTWTAWMAKPGEMVNGVKYAIAGGYRHIDCAWLYDNEDEVGQAIAEKIADGTIQREDIFVTIKIWNTHHARPRVMENAQKSLKKLQLSYANLALMHSPTSFQDGDEHFPKDENGKIIFAYHDMLDTWKGMEDLVEAGLARNIGISNFNSKQIQRVLDAATIKPCNLQIEVNPTFTNEKLVRFAHSKNLVVSSYAPLGAPGRPWYVACLSECLCQWDQFRGEVHESYHIFVAKESTDPCAIEHSVVLRIARKKYKTPGQVILRWLLQRGLCVCVKSLNARRILQNLDLFDFELTEQEMSQISALNRNFRMYAATTSLEHPEHPFHEEF